MKIVTCDSCLAKSDDLIPASFSEYMYFDEDNEIRYIDLCDECAKDLGKRIDSVVSEFLEEKVLTFQRIP